MFNSEVRSLLIQVISSWQVIVATVAVVLFIALVNNVARIYRRRPERTPRMSKPKAKAKAKEKEAEPQISDEADELGLEENVLDEE